MDIPLPPELAALEPGDPRAIGPFRLIGRLGSGGMGAVYGALDAAHRCVAVKVVHPRHASAPEYRAAFAREADLMRGLDAECAPAFLGADPSAEPPWLAIEFVPGRTLRARVRESGPLEPPVLAAFAAGTAEALEALHRLGVVHCDIKPGNVVLSPTGPRVLDFGIARAAGRPGPERIEGTPGYLAPERLGGAPPSPAVDVFAWGAMVAFAATGRPPFGGGEVDTVLARTRAGEHDLEGVPEEILGIVTAALDPDPGRRPSALDCFAAALEAAAPEGAGETTSAGAEPARAEAGTSPRTRLRSALASVWRGFDAAGHSPEAWMAVGTAVAGAAAAATATSGIGAGAGAAGAGVAGGGAASAAGSGAAGSGAAAAGAGSGAIGAGAGGGLGGAAATGGGSALLGAKGIAIASAAVIAAGTAGVGGYFGYESYAATQRAELAGQAAALLEDGAGFTASLVREPADGGTGGGEPFTAELLYATDPQDVLVYRVPPEQGGETVANTGGRVLAYAPREAVIDDPVGWYAEADRFTTDAYSRDAVLGAVEALAGAEDLEGVETEVGGAQVTRLTGTFTIDGPDGEPTDARGELNLDGEGVPLRLAYTSPDWTTTVDFTSVDEAPSVGEPEGAIFAPETQIFEIPYDALMYTPACGQVSMGGSDWNVHAVSWEMGCKEAVDLAERFASGEGEVMTGWAGTGLQRLYLDGHSCEQLTPHAPEGGPGDELLPMSCETTRQNPDAASPLDEYEVGESVVRFTEA
ncbi:serine/threonine-protein kinase [Nocardiopsis sp. RSe5-2]|uniref:Serine/threonine-protein kinase n=1 Tax=Nocardiopsis endophytica TaxID=3018445 RepID=A0ABT4UCF7_9ACTN|nr:serine/threonine-protein kinase [Nocardiopsis endophytica]MDA2814431.1 serine/threonine-protein kinase [Nocardiopsis endophytica]